MEGAGDDRGDYFPGPTRQLWIPSVSLRSWGRGSSRRVSQGCREDGGEQRRDLRGRRRSHRHGWGKRLYGQGEREV
jgi:hypothetical protein